MAKCTITIEDTHNGRVKVTADPTFEMLMAMDISGSKLTAAHGYLFAALNRIQEVSKSNDPIKRMIPKIGG